MLTVASAFVGAQFHEMRAGARKGLIVVNETEMRAGLLAIDSRTWVWSWGEVGVENSFRCMFDFANQCV